MIYINPTTFFYNFRTFKKLKNHFYKINTLPYRGE